MSPVLFKITNLGKRIVLDDLNTGLTLRLAEVGIGTGKYTPTGQETALTQEVGRYPLSVAQITHNKQLMFSVSIETAQMVHVSEFGLFDEHGRLFALASTTDEFLTTYPDIEFIGEFNLALDEIDVSKIELITDPQGGLALQLMTAHIAEPHPHSQYALKEDVDRVLLDMRNTLGEKIQQFNQMIEQLKEQALIPIGGLFLTMKKYTASQLKAEKGYGNWIWIARGRALVGAGSTGWSGQIGAVAGSDTHTLLVSQMPKHSHPHALQGRVPSEQFEYDGFILNEKLRFVESYDNQISGNGTMIPKDDWAATGGGQPQNNRQKSLAIGVWQRVSDNYKEPTIEVYFSSDPQGTNIITGIEQGKDAYFWVKIAGYQIDGQVVLYPLIAIDGMLAIKDNVSFVPESLYHTNNDEAGVGLLKPFDYTIDEGKRNGTHLLFKINNDMISAYKKPTLKLGVIDELGREHLASLIINGGRDKSAWLKEMGWNIK